MSEFFLDVVNMSISASWLVLAVLALRLMLKKAPKWVNVLFWGVVAVRLICPFSLESAFSLIPSKETISPEIMMDWTPEISTGIEPLDRVVNPVITSSFAPEPSASANPLQILIPAAANLWLLGVLVMLLYTAFSYCSLRRKLRTAVILRDNVFQCETVHSPFVLGIFRPKIYLPYTIDGGNLHHVVAHEQAHIRRKDHWWKPLGFFLLSIYWFNPLLWVAYILLCRDIELACDEKVIAELGNDQRADYTQALVACSVKRRTIAACPLAFGEAGIKERVRSIMHYRKPAFWVVLLALIACAAVAVCFLTDPAADTQETEDMHQESFLYATEEGYNLLIGAEGVYEIQVSLPDSGGGVVNADGTSFKKGEKVYLEPLQGIADLRGLAITALGKNGEVLYGLSIPEDASMEEAINTVGSDGWLLAPTEHIVGPTMDEITDQLHELQKLESEQEASAAESIYDHPPALTISYGEEKIEDARIGTLSWEYIKEDGTHGVLLGDGAHPLDAKQSSPFFVLNPYAETPFEIRLSWDLMPDSVLVRYWGEESWGELETEPTGRILMKEKNKADNTCCFEPNEENCIYEILATWDNEPSYSGKVYYNFHCVMTDKVPSDQELYEKYISDSTKGKHRYVDVDEDGKQELFISRNNGEDELVSVVDGKIVRILYENHLFLCEDGIIGQKSEGSGGQTLIYYKIENQEPVIVDAVTNLANDDTWYHTSDVTDIRYVSYKTMNRITEEEAHRICAQYPRAEDSMSDSLSNFYPE